MIVFVIPGPRDAEPGTITPILGVWIPGLPQRGNPE
jgi:hypothetical protein